MHITVYGKLPSLNDVINASRTNKYAAAKLKREVEALLIPQLPNDKLTGCYDFTFTWTEPNRKRDPDNIASAVKFIFDALQTVGALDNDGWKQVQSISHRFQVGTDYSVRIDVL